ncbi:uncharacterized protein LOC128726300 [Anopheles nili]|uniref:uncharacterized protein LOC128726300 n=1 Tax=Anopheles nili TaxID=185578 RepID=UPI00237B949F|nr:uncharacterized protein LOC128726300 [Anopheles nili]
MGRKIHLERPKKGPGRKARKQPEPMFKFNKSEDDEQQKKMSRHQIQRLKKREQVKAKQKVEQKSKKALQKVSATVATGSFDPSEIFNLEKSRQKYQQLGQKSKQQSTVANGHNNGVAKKGLNLFDSDNEPDDDEQQHSVVRVKKSQMKKFLQQAESEDEDSDEDDSVNSDEDQDTETAADIEQEDDEDEDDKEELDEEEEDEDMEEDSDEQGEVSDEEEEEEDDDDDDMDDDDDDDDDDDEDMLPIEAANKKLKKRMAKEQKEADDEMAEAAKNRERFQFPTEEEIAQTANLQDVNIRIKDVIGVLADFSANRDPNKSRCEYVELLKKDLCLYYSYNEYFMGLLMDIFSPNELLEFLEASELQRPITIRTNSLKTRRRDLAQALINRGINLDPIGKWSKEGLVVYSSQVPLGATPEYLAGHYMLQGGSSMLPVMALAPEENERILDLCAAPGGKSSHISALMKNTGVLFVNDSNKDRLLAVLGNFHRLGIQNAVITCVDGIKYKDIMKGFDRVLLDAPCTGSGVISKDPSVKATKTDIDVQRCYNLQRRLLLTAIDCLSASSKTGGYLVYSTCSILPQENEWVIDYALKMRNVRLVSTGLDFGVEGMTRFGAHRFHPSMKLTRRFYPHTHNLDGFFVAKLQKFSDAIPKNISDGTTNGDAEDVEAEVEEIIVPKKIDKRDWYYKDIIEKRKAEREDTNHVVKVFQKPTNTKTKGTKKSKKAQHDESGKKEQTVPIKSAEEKLSNGKQKQVTKASNAETRDAEEALRLKKKLKQTQQQNGSARVLGKDKKNGNKKGKSLKNNAFKQKVGKVRKAK